MEEGDGGKGKRSREPVPAESTLAFLSFAKCLLPEVKNDPETPSLE